MPELYHTADGQVMLITDRSLEAIMPTLAIYIRLCLLRGSQHDTVEHYTHFLLPYAQHNRQYLVNPEQISKESNTKPAQPHVRAHTRNYLERMAPKKGSYFKGSNINKDLPDIAKDLPPTPTGSIGTRTHDSYGYTTVSTRGSSVPSHITNPLPPVPTGRGGGSPSGTYAGSVAGSSRPSSTGAVDGRFVGIGGRLGGSGGDRYGDPSDDPSGGKLVPFGQGTKGRRKKPGFVVTNPDPSPVEDEGGEGSEEEEEIHADGEPGPAADGYVYTMGGAYSKPAGPEDNEEEGEEGEEEEEE
jgi:hypothetical protein